MLKTENTLGIVLIKNELLEKHSQLSCYSSIDPILISGLEERLDSFIDLTLAGLQTDCCSLCRRIGCRVPTDSEDFVAAEGEMCHIIMIILMNGCIFIFKRRFLIVVFLTCASLSVIIEFLICPHVARKGLLVLRREIGGLPSHLTGRHHTRLLKGHDCLEGEECRGAKEKHLNHTEGNERLTEFAAPGAAVFEVVTPSASFLSPLPFPELRYEATAAQAVSHSNTERASNEAKA